MPPAFDPKCLRAIGGVLFLGFALLDSPQAASDEIYACADGSTLRVTNANRVAMRQHPCVKAWFATDRLQSVSATADDDAQETLGLRLTRTIMPSGAAQSDVRTDARPADPQKGSAASGMHGKPHDNLQSAEAKPSLIILNAKQK